LPRRSRPRPRNIGISWWTSAAIGVPTATCSIPTCTIRVPALAILDAHGKLLYSQKAGEFEAMRHMESSAVTQFLLRWKARKSA
jgi:hypothetical protein